MPPKPQSPEEKALKLFLTSLGLSPDEAAIYKTLCDHGSLTTLELARKTTIPRTRVYRTLEKLRSQKLVEEIIDEHRTLAAAVSPDRLNKLLKNKQNQVAELTQLFPQVQSYLNQQINRRQPDTNVKFYKGVSGIQQMASNVLNASGEIVGYTQTDFDPVVGNKFATWFYNEIIANNLHMRDIYSDRYIDSVGGVTHLGQTPPNISGHFASRYLPPEKIDVVHTLDIYNHTVAFYDWQGPESEIFGVEIYNPKVAAMQKQIFELLWNLAIPEGQIIQSAGAPQ